MSFHHACFEPRATTDWPKTPPECPTVAKEPPAPSGEESGRSLKASYAAQAIVTAANDLLDCALAAESLDDALELAQVVRLLRQRIDAIANGALDRANELCG